MRQQTDKRWTGRQFADNKEQRAASRDTRMHTAADQMCQEGLQWSLQPQNSNKTVTQLKTCCLWGIS